MHHSLNIYFYTLAHSLVGVFETFEGGGGGGGAVFLITNWSSSISDILGNHGNLVQIHWWSSTTIMADN